MDTPPDMRPSSNYIINGFLYFRNINKSGLSFILKLRGRGTKMDTPPDMRPSSNYILKGFVSFRKIIKKKKSFELYLKVARP